MRIVPMGPRIVYMLTTLPKAYLIIDSAGLIINSRTYIDLGKRQHAVAAAQYLLQQRDKFVVRHKLAEYRGRYKELKNA